jgi:inward rectifier potassium channel
MRPTPPTARAKRRKFDARTSIAAVGFEFKKIGATRFDLADPYHIALTVHWPAFVVGLFAMYGLITSLFAGLYLLQPGSIANVKSPADAFFFSIETLATVGYGVMAPSSFYGHLISSAEIVTGMAFTAIMTGLIFVRFSKARARIVFADVAVIARHNGRPTLMVRIGNGRTSLLTQTSVQFNAFINEETAEGGRFRRVYDLRLTRATFPIFPLITTFMHVIDEQSPLGGFDIAALPQTDLRIMVTIQARDPQLGAIVHDLRSYAASDLRPGMRFLDAITVHEDGSLVADLTRIGEIEPDASYNGPPAEARLGAPA